MPPPRLDNLVVENAYVFYRNFAGLEKQFNSAGDRNFCLGLEPEQAETMRAQGWNVKETKPRDEGDEPRPYIQVAVKYENYPPRIFLITQGGTRRVELEQEQLILLDGGVDIKNWDLVISPSRWEVNGNTGIKAYLKKAFVTLDEDILDKKYMGLDDGQDPTKGLATTVNEED